MIRSIRRAMVAGAILAVGALGAPTMAAATTPTPALPAGALQAAVSQTNNGARAATTRSYQGRLTWTRGGFSSTCAVSTKVNYALSGVAVFNGATFAPTPCPTSVSGCFATKAVSPAPSDTWGARVITWPGTTPPFMGTYILVNVSHTVTYSGLCPVPTGVPFTLTGTLWLRAAPFGGGTPITALTPTAPFDVLSNPSTGPFTISNALGATTAEPPLYPTM